MIRYDVTPYLIPRDPPSKCMHTLAHKDLHAHKVRKDLTVSIKTRVDGVSTGASKSHKNISKSEAQSCLFKTHQYKYQQPLMVASVSTAIRGIEKFIHLCYSTVRGFSMFTGPVGSNSHSHIY